MSIKDFFYSKPTTAVSAVTASANIESKDFIVTKIISDKAFTPHLDFSSASNFAKFGSAYEYYTKSIERIYNDYPYDGSEKEKLLFKISSSYLDEYIFDKKYPKTTGYINFSYNGWGPLNGPISSDGYGLPTNTEYIFIKGGLHTRSGLRDSKLKTVFQNSPIIYESSKNRTTTFPINPQNGFSVEFWLKKDRFLTLTKTIREVVLDLWNGELSSSSNYGRFTIELISGNSPFRVTLQSGSTGFFQQTIGTSGVTAASLSNWGHYAFTFVSGATGTTSRLYKNGELEHEVILGSSGVNSIGGMINGYIGALQTSPSGSSAPQFSGKLSASLDEFRFWKSRRTSEQIYNNWYRSIGGGTNSDDANVDLGLYYKFNEGIVGNSTTDSVILDYSGRIANGVWNGYLAGARNTGSAFVSSSFSYREKEDPIIYSQHPRVSSLLLEMQTSGSAWDEENPSLMYNSMPQWIRDEDGNTNENTKYLFQIMSSYFDTLYSQITVLPHLKNVEYINSKYKPKPFADRLIEDKGILVPNLFVDSDILEKYGSRDSNNILFEDDIVHIKNFIYTNIYNNLNFILKSKGTEKSIRNMLRCFGVDDEVVKLNIYTDGGTHYFSDKRSQTSIRKKNINFNNANLFESSIFQTSSANVSYTFVTGSGQQKLEKYSAMTTEINIEIPFKKSTTSPEFFSTQFISSSIYGMHEPVNSLNYNDYTWKSQEIANFQVYLVRDKLQSSNAKYVLKNQDGTINLETDFFREIYDGDLWTLAVRVRPDNWPIAGGHKEVANPTYTLEFYGVTHAFDTVESEFSLTTSLSYDSGSSFLSNPKRFYVGAHRQNFTGSVLQNTDLKVVNFRHYFDFLENDILKSHNLDITNYATGKSFKPNTPFNSQLGNTAVNSADAIAINWDFDTVVSSDSQGKFIVDDASSGSLESKYLWADNIVLREHRAVGFSFPVSDSSFISRESIFVNKKQLPENSYTADDVYIEDQEREFFIVDEDLSDNFFAIEKSMNQVVSQEMLNSFSSVAEFNSLIGKAVDRYRVNYKKLNFLKNLFFEKNSGSLNYEKFTDYYKWIDSSISYMINQLFPVSANHSEGVMDVIESHLLERNKYQNKFPLLTRYTATENSMKGINELSYNWKFGHAPITESENENCLWQKERKERSDIIQRETIRKVIINDSNATSSVLSTVSGVKHQSNLYVDQRLSKPYVFDKKIVRTIHGGINYSMDKDREYIHNAVHRHGKKTQIGIPVNVLLVGESTGSAATQRKFCDDIVDPNKKITVNVKVVAGKYSGDGVDPAPLNDNLTYLSKTDVSKIPMNILSQSINTGYQAKVSSSYSDKYVFTNIHSDTTDFTNEIPMQGPFPQQWVGGHQSRHTDINKYDASLRDDFTGGTPLNSIQNQYTRPEAWRLLLGERDPYNGDPKDGAFGFTGFDYGGPYPDPTRKGATFYRGLRAKRPFNIKNIKTTTSSYNHGNYYENYELISAGGTKQSNNYFVKNPQQSNYLPEYIVSGTLPETTNPLTLIAYRPSTENGNVFGTHNNNRQPDQKFVAGSKAASSFFAYGVSGSAPYSRISHYVTDGHGIRLTSGFSTNLELDNNGSTSLPDSPTSFSISNTVDSTTYWNALSSSLNNDPNVNATYTVINAADNFTKGLDCLNSGSAHATLSSSTFVGATSSPQFSFSSWIQISTGSVGNGVRKYLFELRDMISGQTSLEAFIETTTADGDLKVYQYAGGGGGSTGIGTKNYIRVGEFEAAHNNKWIHLVITSGGDTDANNNLKVYVNAQLQPLASEQKSGLTGKEVVQSGSFFLMSRGQVANQFLPFNGKFDEVTFWNTELSPNEIDKIYNAGVALNFTASNYSSYSLPSTSNLVSWWSFDNLGSSPLTTGQTITDTNANNNLTVNDYYFDNGANRHRSFHPVNGIYRAKPMARFDITASVNGTVFNGLAASATNTAYGVASDSVEGTNGLYYYPDHSSSFSGSSVGGFKFVGGVDDLAESRNLHQINDSLISGKKNRTIITSRFSAPGGIEVQSLGYLDAYSHEYSAHNALPFRNLTVRLSGSGETGTIRQDTHSSRREGLRTLLSRHSGKFGIDSQYGSVSAASYPDEPSFHKIHRNIARKPTDASTLLSPVFNTDHNNGFIQSPIPQSEYQYTWVTGAIGSNYSVGSGKQRIYGYAPRNGEVSASYYGIVEALVFPSASEIFGV